MLGKLKDRRVLWLGVILSVISIGLMVQYPTPIDVNNRVDYSNWFQVIAVLAVIGWGVYIFRSNDEELFPQIWEYVVGVILASFYVSSLLLSAGQDGSNTNGLVLAGVAYVKGPISFLLTLLSFLSWAILFAFIMRTITVYFGWKVDHNNPPKIWKIVLSLLVLWLIVIVVFFPGQISFDAMRQFCEYEGQKILDLGITYPHTNHHPYFVTLLFGHLFTLGRMLYGVNTGVFTVVLFQVMVTVLTYAGIVSYVWKKIGRGAGLIALLIFGSPIFSTYAVTIDKSSIYYSLCGLFYLTFINVFEIINDKEPGFKPYIYFCLVSFVFSEFRNDSKYIVLISTLVLMVLAVYHRWGRLQLVVTLAVILTALLSWNFYLKQEKVIPSAEGEALTIPTRQLSYIYLTDRSSLSKQQVQVINRVTPVTALLENYNVNEADNLKNLYPSNTFLGGVQWDTVAKKIKEGKITIDTTSKEKQLIKAYLKVWLEQGLKHPLKYLAVYIAANSHYFNPTFGVTSTSYNGMFVNNIRFGKIVQPTWYGQYHSYAGRNEYKLVDVFISLYLGFPLISIFANVAVPLYVTIFLLGVILARKKWQWLIVMVPLVLMVALYTLTPVNGYSRYTIGASVVVPIVVSFLWNKVYQLRRKING